MIDYADINTNEKARKYYDEHIAYMKMMGNRYFSDDITIAGVTGEIKIYLDRTDGKVDVEVEDKVINEFKLEQDIIRVVFENCHINRFELAENLNGMGIKSIFNSEIDTFIVNDQDTLVNSLKMYDAELYETPINELYVKFTKKNSKTLLNEDVVEQIDSALNVKRVSILVDINLIGPFTITEDTYRDWKVEELKEVIPEMGIFEYLEVSGDTLEIHHQKNGKMQIMKLDMNTVSTRIRQLVWNEFAYVLAMQLMCNESDFIMKLINKDGTTLELEEFINEIYDGIKVIKESST